MSWIGFLLGVSLGVFLTAYSYRLGTSHRERDYALSVEQWDELITLTRRELRVRAGVPPAATRDPESARMGNVVGRTMIDGTEVRLGPRREIDTDTRVETGDEPIRGDAVKQRIDDRLD